MNIYKLKRWICMVLVLCMGMVQVEIFAQETQTPYMVTKSEFLERTINLHSQLSGETVTGDASFMAQKLNIMSKEQLDTFLTDTSITRQEAASVLYKMILAYDPTLQLESGEVPLLLNGCYDNAMVEEQNRESYAFMIKHNIIESKTVTYPYATIDNVNMEQMLYTAYDTFLKKDSITVGAYTVSVGQSAKSLVRDFGMPNRIDTTEYGFSWYIYNEDYTRFMMIGVQNGTVCAFYSNAKGMQYHGVKTGGDIAKLADKPSTMQVTASGKLDGVYYNTKTQTATITEKMREAKQLQFLDMVNAYRAKQLLPIFAVDEDLMDNALSVSKGDTYEQAGVLSAVKVGVDIFHVYGAMVLSGEYNTLFDGGVKYITNTGVGAWYTDTGLSIALLNETNSIVKQEVKAQSIETKPIEPQKQDVQVQSPVLKNPIAEQVYEFGMDVVIDIEKETAPLYLVQVVNTQTMEHTVNAYFTGGRTRFVLPTHLFENGIDYTVSVSGVDNDIIMPPTESTIVYGHAQSVTIKSPSSGDILVGNSVHVEWESAQYSDFELELYRDGEWVCSTRVSDVNQTELMDLEVGSYSLGVSALRKNSNIIKNTAWVNFDISSIPITYETQFITREDGTIQEVKVPIVGVGKTRFTSEKYARVFGGNSVYTTQADADVNMTTVTIPVWKLKSNNTKYSSKMQLTVHNSLADDVVGIFTDIYNGSEQFPIESVGGYAWRDTATGTTSQHSYGTCIDINPTQNYCVYRSGKTIGSFWKPYDNPYSITPDGDVMKAFAKYGWVWGGNWNSVKDYMHFSYLGG